MKKAYLALGRWAFACALLSLFQPVRVLLAHDHWQAIEKHHEPQPLCPLAEWWLDVEPEMQAAVCQAQSWQPLVQASWQRNCPAELQHVNASQGASALWQRTAENARSLPQATVKLPAAALPPRPRPTSATSSRRTQPTPPGISSRQSLCALPGANSPSSASENCGDWLSNIGRAGGQLVVQPSAYSASDYQVYDYPPYFGRRGVWAGPVSLAPEVPTDASVAGSNSPVQDRNMGRDIYVQLRQEALELASQARRTIADWFAANTSASSAQQLAPPSPLPTRPKFAYDPWFTWRGLEPVGETWGSLVFFHWKKVCRLNWVSSPGEQLGQWRRNIEMHLCGTPLLADWYTLKQAWDESELRPRLHREESAQRVYQSVLVSSAVALDQVSQRLAWTADRLLQQAAKHDRELAARWASRQAQTR